jgi:hypothetical protein
LVRGRIGGLETKGRRRNIPVIARTAFSATDRHEFTTRCSVSFLLCLRGIVQQSVIQLVDLEQNGKRMSTRQCLRSRLFMLGSRTDAARRSSHFHHSHATMLHDPQAPRFYGCRPFMGSEEDRMRRLYPLFNLRCRVVARFIALVPAVGEITSFGRCDKYQEAMRHS